MAEETSTTSQEKTWFADLNWRTNALFLFISIFGGFSGATIAPTKSTAQGISQDQADVRYLTKEKADVNYLSIDAADKRGEKRDKTNERIENKIDENQRKNEAEQKEVRNLLNQILINQQASK